jgi:hypothetical protein
MKAMRPFYLFLLAAAHCSRNEDHFRSMPASSGGMTQAKVQTSGEGGADNDASYASAEEIDRFLEARYGDLIPRSGQQLKAVAAADEYLDRRKTVIERPHRYLVRKTVTDWEVTVLSLEGLRRSEKRGTLIVHLVEENGELHVTSIGAQD